MVTLSNNAKAGYKQTANVLLKKVITNKWQWGVQMFIPGAMPTIPVQFYIREYLAKQCNVATSNLHVVHSSSWFYLRASTNNSKAACNKTTKAPKCFRRGLYIFVTA